MFLFLIFVHENDLEFSLRKDVNSPFEIIILVTFFENSAVNNFFDQNSRCYYIFYLLIGIFQIFWQEKKARMWSEFWPWKQLTSPNVHKVYSTAHFSISRTELLNFSMAVLDPIGLFLFKWKLDYWKNK